MWACSAGGSHGDPPGASRGSLDAGARDGGTTADAAGSGDDGADGVDGAAGGDAPADAALRVCDVKQYGAKGDGVTKDTAAIQAAIDDCAVAGGEVELEGGVFLSGMIVLASHITLDIEASATLLGSQDVADYPDRASPVVNTQLADCKKALVYAESAEDVHIQGAGTIDGNASGVADWNGDVVPEGTRPMVIFTVASSNVSIEGITVKNGAVWAVVNMQVEHLTIDGITVDNQLGATHDGIDVVDGSDVLVQNCTIASGDDSICLKSGASAGLSNVTIAELHHHAIGRGQRGEARDRERWAVPEHRRRERPHRERAGGGAGRRVGRRLGDPRRRVPAHHDDQRGHADFVLLGSRDLDPSQVGSIDGVTFDDVASTNMSDNWGSIVTGSIVAGQTFGISNLTFSNLQLAYVGAGASPNPTPYTTDSFPEYQGQVPGQPAGTLYDQYPDAKFITGTGGNANTSYHGPGYAFFVRHASGVTFTSCSTPLAGTDSRPPVATKDVTGLMGTCAP